MVCAPVRRDNPRAVARRLSLRTGAQTMLYLTCNTISSVDLAQYGVALAKDWVSVECGTRESMVCAPVRRDNPQALARGLSHLYHNNQCRPCTLRSISC